MNKQIESIVEEFREKFDHPEHPYNMDSIQDWLTTKLQETQQESYERGRKDREDMIIEKFGGLTDGCGCCAEMDLEDAIKSLKNK